MALKAMADNNVNITAQEDARLYDYLAGQNADYVIQNVGDSLAVSSTTTSLLVTLGSGEAVVQGRHLTNTDSTGVQLTLPQNTTAYLVLRLDLSQSLGNELSFISTPSLEDDDLNNAGVVRDLVLYQYITDANGVATLTDKRNFKTNQTDINDSQTTANNTWSAQKINQNILNSLAGVVVSTELVTIYQENTSNSRYLDIKLNGFTLKDTDIVIVSQNAIGPNGEESINYGNGLIPWVPVPRISSPDNTIRLAFAKPWVSNQYYNFRIVVLRFK